MARAPEQATSPAPPVASRCETCCTAVASGASRPAIKEAASFGPLMRAQAGREGLTAAVGLTVPTGSGTWPKRSSPAPQACWTPFTPASTWRTPASGSSESYFAKHTTPLNHPWPLATARSIGSCLVELRSSKCSAASSKRGRGGGRKTPAHSPNCAH
jgi:hypothetical protein